MSCPRPVKILDDRIGSTAATTDGGSGEIATATAAVLLESARSTEKRDAACCAYAGLERCCKNEANRRMMGSLIRWGAALLVVACVLYLVLIWSSNFRLPLRGPNESGRRDERNVYDEGGTTIADTMMRLQSLREKESGNDNAVDGKRRGAGGGAKLADGLDDAAAARRKRRYATTAAAAASAIDDDDGSRHDNSSDDYVYLSSEPLFAPLEPLTVAPANLYAYRLAPTPPDLTRTNTNVWRDWWRNERDFDGMMRFQGEVLRYAATPANNEARTVDVYVRAIRVLRDFARRFAAYLGSGAVRMADLRGFYSIGASHFSRCTYHVSSAAAAATHGVHEDNAATTASSSDRELYNAASECTRLIFRASGYETENTVQSSLVRQTRRKTLDPITALLLTESWILAGTAIMLVEYSESNGKNRRVRRDVIVDGSDNGDIGNSGIGGGGDSTGGKGSGSSTKIRKWWLTDRRYRNLTARNLRERPISPALLAAGMWENNRGVAAKRKAGLLDWLNLRSSDRDPEICARFRDLGRLAQGRRPFYGDLWHRYVYSNAIRRLDGALESRTSADWALLSPFVHTQVKYTCAGLFGPGAAIPSHWIWPKTRLGLCAVPSIGFVRMYAQRYAFWARIMKPDLPFYTYTVGEFNLAQLHTCAQFRYFAQLDDDSLANTRAFQPGSVVLDGTDEAWVLANCRVNRTENGGKMISLYPLAASGTVMTTRQIGVINQRYEIFRGFVVQEYGLLDYRNHHMYSLLSIENRTGRWATYYTSSRQGEITHRIGRHAVIYADANFDDQRLSSRLLCKPMDFNAFLAQTELTLRYDSFFADGSLCYTLDVDEGQTHVSVWTRDDMIDLKSPSVKIRGREYRFDPSYNQYVHVTELDAKPKPTPPKKPASSSSPPSGAEASSVVEDANLGARLLADSQALTREYAPRFYTSENDPSAGEMLVPHAYEDVGVYEAVARGLTTMPTDVVHPSALARAPLAPDTLRADMHRLYYFDADATPVPPSFDDDGDGNGDDDGDDGDDGDGDGDDDGDDGDGNGDQTNPREDDPPLRD